MSDDLACARARKAAGEWISRTWQTETGFTREALIDAFVAGYAERIHHDVLSADEMTLTARVFDAASRGGDFTPMDMERAARAMLAARDRIGSMADEHNLRVAEGQRQLDDARSLMTEAAELFRGYETHHRDRIERFPGSPRVPEDVAAFKVLRDKVQTNALMAARLEAWLRGDDIYPVTVDRPTLPGFHDGGLVKGPVLRDGDVPAVLTPGLSWPTSNPARVLAQIGETMVDGVTIMGIDGASFDIAARYLDQPVEISALDAPPLADGDLTMVKDALAEERAVACAASGFIPWAGGDGPPADWDRGEVLLDWGKELSRPDRGDPRFTICSGMDLHPEPGLWGADRDPTSYATIIGYRSRMAGKITAHIDPISTKPERRVGIHSERGVVTDIDQEIKYEREGEDFDFTKPITINGHLYAPVGPMTPGAALGLGKLPREMVAAEPDPLAALVHARNWLISAEGLIAEASSFIRGVTGANPGSDSEDICKRLDAWLTPMAE